MASAGLLSYPKSGGENTKVRHILLSLRGRPSLLLLTFVAISYLYLALTPFEWDPPRWVANGARFDNSGTLSFSSAGLLRSDQPVPIVEAAIERNELELCLRFRAALPVQTGPARIFTISADPYLRNLTVAQEFHDLIVRLRTPSTTDNGLPPYIVPDVFLSYDWHELELSIAGGQFQ